MISALEERGLTEECEKIRFWYDGWEPIYELELTNFEVKVMVETMVRGWFACTASNYNAFIMDSYWD